MRKSFWVASVLGLGIVVGSAALYAAPAGGEGAGGGYGVIGRMIRAQIGRAMTLKAELNLTDAQRGAIRESLKSHKSEIAGALKPVVEARRELRDAVLAEKTDDAAIRKAADDLGKRIGDAAVVMAKVKADVMDKAQLTPEQVEKIADFRAESDASIDNFLSEAAQ